MATGQINRGSAMGEILHETCKLPDVTSIVEIGTWNGAGSTRCIMEAIHQRATCSFLSIESNAGMYRDALKNNPDLPEHCKLVLGRIVEIEDVDTSHLQLSDTQKGWLREDIDNYKLVPNVMSMIPEKIDVLLLDGGEFSSEKEFEMLSPRSRYIFMDDTNEANSVKFARIRSRLLQDSGDFKIIEDRINDRNGWMLIERIK